jgi:pyridoxal phosphate enzyme (YggS family)
MKGLKQSNMPIDIQALSENYEKIRTRIRHAAGTAERFEKITLIAVSKIQPVEAIRALYQLGQRDFGENYVQELSKKAELLQDCPELRWHFIGHLQSNKAKVLVPLVSAIHSIDSKKLAREVAKACETTGRTRPLPVFLEVNMDGESTKTGLHPSELKELAEIVSQTPQLLLQGLMCIPSPEGDPSPKFAHLRKLEHELRPTSHSSLSMGMSGDFEKAISAGATHIRVGTALFGARPKAE